MTAATRRFVNHWAWITRQRNTLMDQDTANWILLAKPGTPMHHADLDWGTWPRRLATGLLEDIAADETAAFHAIFATGRAKLERAAAAIARSSAQLPACEAQPDGCASATVTRYGSSRG